MAPLLSRRIGQNRPEVKEALHTPLMRPPHGWHLIRAHYPTFEATYLIVTGNRPDPGHLAATENGDDHR